MRLRTNGITVGSWVIDRFPGDRPNPPHEVVGLEDRESVSPEGYAVFRVLAEDGRTYPASAFDCVPVANPSVRT